VAAEFSLVALDPASVERKVTGGDKRLNRVLRALKSLSTQLSGAQVGITLTTILLGYTTQVALVRMFSSSLTGLGVSIALAATLGALASVIIVNVFSMLFGELVPKNMALAEPLRTARLTAPAQLVFTWLFRPPHSPAQWNRQRDTSQVRCRAGGGALECAFRLGVSRPSYDTPLMRELLMWTQRNYLQDPSQWESLTAIDVMTRSWDASESLARGRGRRPTSSTSLGKQVTLASQLGDRDGEDFVSIALLRRAIAIPHDRRGDVPVSSRSVSIAADQVPESVGILPLLVELRDGVQMAVVVDEYGVVFRHRLHWKMLFEEVVGEVSDEHDRRRRGIKATTRGGYMVPGTLRPDELASQTGIHVDEDGPYEEPWPAS
jgi:CBS domain containing-hemolysin-like protein